MLCVLFRHIFSSAHPFLSQRFLRAVLNDFVQAHTHLPTAPATAKTAVLCPSAVSVLFE